MTRGKCYERYIVCLVSSMISGVFLSDILLYNI